MAPHRQCYEAAMGLLRSVVLIATIAACSSHTSTLDRPPPANGSLASVSTDPWQGTSGKRNDDDKRGFDLPGALEKIGESISKPGPYEAPQHSPDFAEDKPHWGVVRLRGAVVEREAFTFTGGRGVELRQLIDRLHQLAADPKLTGVLIRLES